MSSATRLDLTVIIPFADDEEVLGGALRRMAAFFRASGAGFEILAVDEDSGDNSHAVLAILRPELPELRVLHAPTRGRGAETGAARAQGGVMAIVSPALTEAGLPALAAAIQRVTEGVSDLEFAIGQFIVAHRARSLDAFHGVRLAGEVSQRRLAKQLAARGFRVKVDGVAAQAVVAAAPARRSWRDMFAAPRRI